MRDILFRGKSTNGIGWIEGSLRITTIQPADDSPFKKYEIEDTTCGVFPNDFMIGICETVYPETVGQFTGLTDKNGKRIFEGDIVRTKKYGKIVRHSNVNDYDTFKVIYVHARFIVDNKYRYFNLVGSGADYEIIGNIYDNPELLEVSGNA